MRLSVLPLAAAFYFALLPSTAKSLEGDPFEQARQKMLAEIQADMSETGPMTGRSGFSPKVLEAMKTVPRHLFVPQSLLSIAYENRPLPIGYGQTISQPYIVALMTELLDPAPTHTVLEIGTGSGYQAAALSRLVKEVYSVEIVPELSKSAGERLARLDYANVKVRQGDGYFGWPEMGPFDGIIVTAAIDHIPPPLISQLKPGGRMIIPVGPPFLPQTLVLVLKTMEGKITTRQILPVRFVPFTRGK